MKKYRDATIDDIGKNVDISDYDNNFWYMNHKLIAVVEDEYRFITKNNVNGATPVGWKYCRIEIEKPKFESTFAYREVTCGDGCKNLLYSHGELAAFARNLEERIWELENEKV